MTSMKYFLLLCGSLFVLESAVADLKPRKGFAHAATQISKRKRTQLSPKKCQTDLTAVINALHDTVLHEKHKAGYKKCFEAFIKTVEGKTDYAMKEKLEDLEATLPGIRAVLLSMVKGFVLGKTFEDWAAYPYKPMYQNTFEEPMAYCVKLSAYQGYILGMMKRSKFLNNSTGYKLLSVGERPQFIDTWIKSQPEGDYKTTKGQMCS